MKKIIIANWKMNHGFDGVDEWLGTFFKAYADQYNHIKNRDLVLCPPAIFLDYIDSELMEDGFQFLEETAKKDGRDLEGFSAEEINNIVIDQRLIKLGAQDCHSSESGSFTGDVSAKMLKEVGCKYVILGHSERRSHHAESNAQISEKLAQAGSEGLIPVFCIGESKELRDSNQYLEFLQKQVTESLSSDVKFDKLVIAYEPIWSIGTGVIPTVEQIKEVIEFIKNILREKFSNSIKEFSIVYGGSVTSENSPKILEVSDGLLVGKASLDAVQFVKIASS